MKRKYSFIFTLALALVFAFSLGGSAAPGGSPAIEYPNGETLDHPPAYVVLGTPFELGIYGYDLSIASTGGDFYYSSGIQPCGYTSTQYFAVPQDILDAMPRGSGYTLTVYFYVWGGSMIVSSADFYVKN
ncbi:hypothetical protein LJK87_16980 [Paenibacillus sp. P25]|nr:hypothetical protein LJK87_16980 [Paenibacillus sp. P25]